MREICFKKALAQAAIIGVVSFSIGFNLARAQSTAADIVGTVRDASGAVVPNVAVKVVQQETNFSRETKTNTEGIYEFRILQPGTYNISAEASGFKKYMNAKVPLTARQVLRIDIGLEVGNVADTVTVTAEAPVTVTDTASVAESRGALLLNDGPQGTPVMAKFGINTGQFSLLIRQGGWVEASFKGSGARGGQWETSINGNAAEVSWPSLSVPYQAISEEKQTVSEASAEFRAPMTIDAVTKQGTNDFHGSVTFNFGHSRLNALPATSTTSARGPQLPWHNWNLTGGGPVYIPKVYDGRNRTWLFASAERNPPTHSTSLWSQSTGAGDMPTMAMREGDFSRFFAATGRPGKTLIDPLSGIAFANNVIPRSRWNPAAIKAVDKYYQPPNVATANPDIPSLNYDVMREGDGSSSALFARIDQKISDKNTAGFYYDQGPLTTTFSEGPGYDYKTIPSIPGGIGPSSKVATPKQFGWNDTHIFSPTIVNEARVSYFIGDERQYGNGGRPAGEVIDALGIDLGPDAAIRKEARQAPSISVTGFQRIGSTYTDLDRKFRWLQIRDNLSIQRGRHSFKAGYDHRFKSNDDTAAAAALAGVWNFTGTFTGEPFADFLIGLPENTQRYTSAVRVFQRRYSELGFFLQDDFKASSRLTLNLGVRYDYVSPRTEANGAYLNFDPSDGALVLPDEKSIAMVHPAFPATIKLKTAAQAGFPDKLMDGVHSISPRIGFAYRLTDAPSTVLRGSYGIFTVNAGWKNGNFNTIQSGAFALTETFVNTISGGTPLVTLDRPFPSTVGTGPSTVSVGGSVPDLGIPYLQQWNVTLERQISTNWAAHLSYVGAKNTQLTYRRNINKPAPSLIPYTPSRLIYPGYLNITMNERGGNSTYHSMHAGFNHRLANGLLVEGLFQWVNEISDVGEDGIDVWQGQVIENPYCRSCERGKGLIDSLDFRTNLVYELPFGRGKAFGANSGRVANGFIGGWSFGAIFDARNGRPDTVTFSGADPSNTNTIGGRADFVAGCNERPGDGKTAPYLNINCFSVPQAGTFGNIGRTAYRRPGSWDVSGTLYKYFTIREGIRLRFNGVFNNAFNHPTWNEVGDDISVPANFGKFISQQSFGRWVGSRSITLQAQVQW